MNNPFDNFKNKIVFTGNDGNIHEYVCPTREKVIKLIKNDFGWYGIDPGDIEFSNEIDAVMDYMYPFTKAGRIRDLLKSMMPNIRYDSFSGHSPLDYHHLCYNFQYYFLEYAYDTGEPNENFTGECKNHTVDEFVAAVLKIGNNFYPDSNIKGEVAIRKAVESNRISDTKELAIERKNVKALAIAIANSFVQRTKKYPGGVQFRNYLFTMMNRKIQYAICYYFEVYYSSDISGLEKLNIGEIVHALHRDEYTGIFLN